MRNTYDTDIRISKEVLRDLQRNFANRRLLLIALHVLVPAFLLSSINFVTAKEVVAGYRFLSTSSVEFSAMAIAIASLCIAYSMARCHHGITLNGEVVNKRLYRPPLREIGNEKMNPLSISGSFFQLAVFSALVGGFILFYRLAAWLFSAIVPQSMWQGNGASLIALFASVVLVIGAYLIMRGFLFHVHRRAVKQLVKYKPESFAHDRDDEKLIAEHRMNSLDDTNDDVGVVVVTAVVLFSALLTVLSYSTSINAELVGDSWRDSLETGITPVLSLYGIAVMWLSQRMILRLRFAVAEHSSMLADINGCRNLKTWTPEILERTKVFYLLLWFMLLVLLNVFIEYWYPNAGLVCFALWVCILLYVILAYERKLAKEQSNFVDRFGSYFKKLI